MSKSFRRRIFLFFSLFIWGVFSFSQEGKISGYVLNSEDNVGIEGVHVQLEGTEFSTETNYKGKFKFENLPYDTYNITFEYNGSIHAEKSINLNQDKVKFTVKINKYSEHLDEAVIYASGKKEKKFEDITRLPIAPSEQMQNVFVLDEKLIKNLSATTVAEIAENVSGVYTFATFGGVRESMSIRGFRGVPTLKNGILISKDTGGRGFATDMQGVESVQVIKGADAVNMGASTSYGSAGGLINVVTKTPQFLNRGEVSLRTGSFNQLRPTFDVEAILGNDRKAAFRLNGAFESSRTYQNIKDIDRESFYINPSLAFRPDNLTEIILEADYYNFTGAFDPGTVNRSVGNIDNDLFELPKDKFLGFTGDNTVQKLFTATARIKRDISKNLYVRGAAYFSDYDTSGPSSQLTALPTNEAEGINVDKNTVFARGIRRHKEHSDKYFVAQTDLVGDHIKTGDFTHTFQVGVDYRSFDITQRKYNTIAIDTIDITKPVNNNLPGDLPDFTLKEELNSTTNSIGFSAQEYLEIGDRVKIMGGVRIGRLNSFTPESTIVVKSNFINPFAGVMVRVWKDLNVFGNYTNTTDPSTAQFMDINGEPLGNETFHQYEAGIRSSWFDGHLRADLVFYRIDNDGMNIQQTIIDENGISQSLGYYFKGGHIRYKGIEFDVMGQIGKNLSVNAGFARMESKYIKSDRFMIGSSQKNVPDWTAHARADYYFTEGAMKGFSLGAGYYYLGKRPYNDWTQPGVDYHGITPGLEPWDLKAFSRVNMQIGYDFKYLDNDFLRNFQARFILNNIGDAVGYNAYRDVNIDRIEPRNYALTLSYRF